MPRPQTAEKAAASRAAEVKPLSEGLRHFRRLWGLNQEEAARRMGLRSNELCSRREYPATHPRSIQPTAEELGLLEVSIPVARGTILRWCGLVEEGPTWRHQVRSWAFLEPAMAAGLIAQIEALEALRASRVAAEYVPPEGARARSTKRSRNAEAHLQRVAPVED